MLLMRMLLLNLLEKYWLVSYQRYLSLNSLL